MPDATGTEPIAGAAIDDTTPSQPSGAGPSQVSLAKHHSVVSPIWWVGLILATLPALTFARTAANGFVNWDDDANFLENSRFRGVGLNQIRWAWTTFLLGVYQPLSWMLLEVQYAVCGLNPRGYHLTSLAFYAVDTVILYVVVVALLSRAVSDLTARDSIPLNASAAVAVALFAIHPLRTEVVAWVSCQPYLPCALFLMLAVLAYLRANDREGRDRFRWFTASYLVGLCAMLSKPVAVTLPAILLIVDIYPLRRIGPGHWFGAASNKLWLEKAMFGLASLVFGVVALLARDSSRSLDIVQRGGVMSRLVAAGYSVVFYLVKSVVPINIIPCYPSPLPFDWTVPRYLISALAAVSISAGCYAIRRRWPALLAAWAAYLAILLPNSGLVRFTTQLAADRYGYISLMPMVALMGGALLSLTRSPISGRRGFVAVRLSGVVAIGVLASLSWRQTAAWHDSISLWSYALAHGGAQSGDVLSGMGLAMQEAGRPDDAVRWYRESIQLAPHLSDTHSNLGLILSMRGRESEALTEFRDAARLAPRSARMQTNLAACLAKAGQLADADIHYSKATQLDPDDPDSWNNWGLVLSSQGRLADATARLTRAAELRPDSFEVRTNLGVLLARRGLFPRAEAQFAQAVRLAPTSPEAHSRLGVVLARLGRLREAKTTLLEALRLDPGQTSARRELERMGIGARGGAGENEQR